MAGRTLIDGVYKTIKGGKALVNGVSRTIKCGKALLDGVAREIKFGNDVTITGSPHFTYAYVTYNGEKIYSTGVISVSPGDYVMVSVKADTKSIGDNAQIEHNGTIVASGSTDNSAASYSFVPEDDATIRLYRSYNSSGLQAYSAKITGG